MLTPGQKPKTGTLNWTRIAQPHFLKIIVTIIITFNITIVITTIIAFFHHHGVLDNPEIKKLQKDYVYREGVRMIRKVQEKIRKDILNNK